MSENSQNQAKKFRRLLLLGFLFDSHDSLSHCSHFTVKSCIEVITAQHLEGYISSRSKAPDHAILSFRLNTSVVIGDESPNKESNTEADYSPDTVFRRYKFRQMGQNFGSSDIFKEAII